ncbi:cysteine desulfurase NifS [Filifactor alocis]|uniref:cysteine desulfurase NifS n=1 Tax=Filifactor alocis TaxID=143361 RepID=UPI0028E88A12|nr:cysteine desulfurase NifS [Filifactor alocis]
MDRKYVYMDNSATTAVKQEVLDQMMPIFTEIYGNPSSIHQAGQIAKVYVDKARMQVASLLNASLDEIYFTAGGSESDNWALKGVAEKYRKKGNHIITTKIEHHAILHTCEYLEKQGYEVTYLDVDEYGVVDLEQLKKSITDQTILISVMFANNEIGTIQPIEEIGKIAKERKILFHTDAVQVIGNVDIDVHKLNIDMLSMSGHKIHAPKGIGVLYIRKGLILPNLIHGGAQERKRRAGTENVPGIVGLGKACEIAKQHMENHIAHCTKLRDRLIEKVTQKIPYTLVTGSLEHRLPGLASFCFKYIEGEALLLSLDMKGIAGSSGSACTSGSLDPSHVLMALGLKHEIAHGSLRLSLSDFNTEEEVDYVVEELAVIVQRLRNMSPLYDEVLKGENK